MVPLCEIVLDAALLSERCICAPSAFKSIPLAYWENDQVNETPQIDPLSTHTQKHVATEGVKGTMTG